MKFQDWLNENENVRYDDILRRTFNFEDMNEFEAWAKSHRLDIFGPDCFVLAISLLDARIRTLEEKMKDKKK